MLGMCLWWRKLFEIFRCTYQVILLWVVNCGQGAVLPLSNKNMPRWLDSFWAVHPHPSVSDLYLRHWAGRRSWNKWVQCVLMKLTYVKVVETSVPLLCSTHGTVEWYKTLVHGSVEDQLRLVLMYLRVCHCRSHSGNCAAGYMLVTMFMRCMKHCICSPDFAYVKKQLDRSLWSWA